MTSHGDPLSAAAAWTCSTTDGRTVSICDLADTRCIKFQHIISCGRERHHDGGDVAFPPIAPVHRRAGSWPVSLSAHDRAQANVANHESVCGHFADRTRCPT